jgi:uncharacterized protein involved in exopolysaccharide biosynthesis
MDGTHPASADAPRNLGDYLAVCWRYRVSLAAVGIVAGLGALAISLQGPRIYASTVTFAAGLSKIGDAGQPAHTAAAFRPMVESLTTAAAVIADVGLGEAPHNVRPAQFLNQIMAVSEIRGTNLITVTVSYPDATLASTLANRVAEHAVQTARRVSASEASHARDLIKEQLDQARERLDAADSELRSYRQRVRIEALRRDIEARLGGPQMPVFAPRARAQLSDGINVSIANSEPVAGRDGLMEVAVKIASQKARIAAAEQQSQTASLPALRSELAALEQQKAALTRGYTLDASTLDALNRLYAVESDLARRHLEHDVAERTYTDLSQRYQEARLQVIGRSAEFVIIDPAVPADRPVSRHVARNAILGMAIALLFAVAIVVMWDSARRRRVLVS